MFDRFRKTGRNPVRNAVVIVLFGAITIVFVFWGLMPHQGQMQSGGAAAEVNGEFITLSEFEHEISRLGEMYSSMFGQKFNSDAQRQLLKGQAMGGLISLELISQAATSQGLLVSQSELRDQILNIPVFQKDGRFQSEYYNGYLAQTRTRAVDFEKRLRKVQQYQRMNRLFEAALTPVGPEGQKQQMLNNTKLNVSFLRVPREEVSKSISAPKSQAEAFAADAKNQTRLQEYYNANASQFKDKDKTQPFEAAKIEVAKTLLQQDGAEEHIKALEELVKKGDLKGVDSWASTHKVKWDETGEFSLAANQLPKLGEGEQFTKLAWSLSKQKPLATNVVRQGSAVVVLKFKSRSESESKAGEEVTQQTSRRAQEVLGKYVEGLRASAEVHENSELLRQ